MIFVAALVGDWWQQQHVPMAAWAMGRVNSYMRGDKARTADAAIYARYNKKR